MFIESTYKGKVLSLLSKFYAGDTSLEEKRRIHLHIILSIIGIIFLITFSLIAFIQTNYYLSLADLITALILTGNIFHLYKKKKIRKNIVVGIVFVSVLFIYLYVTGGTDETAFMWYFTYPLIACYLLGSYYGIIATAIMLIPILFLIFLNPESEFFCHYSLNFEIRFIATYTVIGFFSYTFERQGELNRKNLREINLSLEKKISDRTEEISKKNLLLKKEMEVRKKANKKAIRSMENLSTIMDSIDSTIYVSDSESCEILFMNKNLTNIMGNNLIGKFCWKSLLDLKKPCGICKKLNIDSKNDLKTEPSIWEGKNPITKKWSINIERTMKWYNDKNVHLHISTDISHIKKIKHEQKIMNRKLQHAQKMEAIGTLAGGIAHDFNNILSGIFGYSQLAKMNINEPKIANKNVDSIVKGAERAAILVRQILTYSRQVDTKKHPTIVYFLAKETLKLLRSTIPTNIEIREEIISKAKILADSTQIHQVIMNLCTNAFQAMSETGGGITIRLKDFEALENGHDSNPKLLSGNYLKLEIEDTGSGIDKENLGKIFNPYFSTKEIGKGTGLGLALVDGIVKSDNGIINVISEAGQGTTFQVFWPIIEKNKISDIQEESNIESLTGTENIMLVDDEQAIVDTLGVILSQKGYHVTTFLNGESALKAFTDNPNQFDLIISDMTMPKMTGDKLSIEILKIRRNIPIIICTGYHEDFAEEKAIEIGIKKYIQKPVIGSELAKIIRDIIDNDQN